jgi:hypothetical protein
MLMNTWAAFFLLAVVNNAAMSISVQIPSLVSILNSFGLNPEVKLVVIFWT